MRKAVLAAIVVAMAAISAFMPSSAFIVRGGLTTGAFPIVHVQNLFGLTGTDWLNTGNYYSPGVGNPAVSTADYYHEDGAEWLRPYDLTDPKCGSAGVTIAASRGRYFWPISSDHPAVAWSDGFDFRGGYSNDPGVPPAKMDLLFRGSYLNPKGNNVAAAPVAVFTGTISGTSPTRLNVTAISSGVVSAPALLTGTGVTAGTHLIANNTGTGVGGTGTYDLDTPQSLGSTSGLTASQTNFQIYEAPEFHCNPDDPSFPFVISGEGLADSIQHEEGQAKSADLISWTMVGPTHINPTFTQWSSFQRVKWLSANNWNSYGLKAQQIFYGAPALFGSGVWTSANGSKFTPDTSLANVCLPPNGTGSATCAAPTDREIYISGFQETTIASQPYLYGKDAASNGSSSGGAFVSRVPIDSGFNVLSSPGRVAISSAYANVFPGPTYLQNVNNYIEDGVAHIYAQVGFPTSAAAVSGGTLVDFATYANGGGLWQQGVDYYTEIVDAAAAAQAAPIGVTASASGTIVTISWYDALPNRTYRVYWGDSSSQTNLVGSVSGTSIAHAGAPQNQVIYYKVVTLQNGVERKSRTVSTFVSSSSAFVNQHITRVLAAGADYGTIDRAWLDQVDGWLSSNSLSNNTMFGTMADFGVVQNQSNVITQIMDVGTTRLPRGGDYTTTTSNTTYNPMGIGSAPAWVNGTATAQGYYGGGRLNNIRRKTQITVYALYQKASTTQVTPLAMNEFGGMALYHSAGTPGAANFLLSDATHNLTATATFTGNATDVHSMAGTFDGTTLAVYADAVAGTTCSGGSGTSCTGLIIPQGNLSSNGNNDALTGSTNTAGGNVPFLGSGSQNSKYIYGTGYSFSNNEAQFNGGAIFVFDKALTPTQIASLDNLIKQHFNPTPVHTYNIVTDFSATCNGSGDDTTAFNNFNSTAKTFQSGTPGLIELDIPQGKTCMFNAGGTGSAFASGIKQLRVVGLGTGATLSNGGVASNSGFFLGALNGIQNGANGTHSAYINTVAAGSNSVTLSTPSQHTLYNVGDWVLVVGIDLGTGTAGVEGSPPNPGFHDWMKIAAKDTVTGKLTFSSVLTNSYKSTWPVFFAGDSTHPDYGGAALVYQLSQDWDTQQEYVNLTISQTGSPDPQTNAIGRDIALKNVTMSGAGCAIPSQNQRFRYIKVTGTSCIIEADKIVDQLFEINSSMQSIHFQSTSVGQFALSGSTFSANMVGSPFDAQVFNSSISSPSVGATCCGVSSHALFHNSTIGSVTEVGASQANVDSAFTMSGGVMSQPLVANSPISWLIPGGSYYFLNGSGTHFPFTANDVSVSGGNVNITTSLGGGFPSAGPLSVHAAPVAVTIN